MLPINEEVIAYHDMKLITAYDGHYVLLQDHADNKVYTNYSEIEAETLYGSNYVVFHRLL